MKICRLSWLISGFLALVLVLLILIALLVVVLVLVILVALLIVVLVLVVILVTLVVHCSVLLSGLVRRYCVPLCGFYSK